MRYMPVDPSAGEIASDEASDEASGGASDEASDEASGGASAIDRGAAFVSTVVRACGAISAIGESLGRFFSSSRQPRESALGAAQPEVDALQLLGEHVWAELERLFCDQCLLPAIARLMEVGDEGAQALLLSAHSCLEGLWSARLWSSGVWSAGL